MRIHNDTKRTIAGYLFISPWLMGFLAFTVIPIATSAFYALTDYDILGAPVFIGFKNFQSMIQDQLFWKSLKVTFSYVFFSVPLRLTFALFIAVVLNRRGMLNRFYQTLYYLPSILGGSIAVAVMWRRLFMADGAFNALLGIIGIHSDVSWIGRESTALGTLVVLAAWQFGSSMLIFLAGLKQIPRSYYEAADIDGAGAIQKFFRITIPYLSSVIFFNLVMQLIAGFTVFTQAFVVSGGNGDPMNSTLVYALYLYQRAFKYYQMGYASALAWILVLIIGAFTILLFRSSGRWVYYESKEGAMMDARRMKKRIGTVSYQILLGVLALVMTYPILWMISNSFKTPEEIFGSASLIPDRMLMENYLRGWRYIGSLTFTTFFKNSFIYSGLATIGVVASSSLVAFGFSRISFRGRSFWFSVMFLTMIIPFQVIMVPQFIIFQKLGWVNTFKPLIVPMFMGFPFFIFLMVQFIRGIPVELDESAWMDGCGRLGIFLRIILPLMKPAIITTTIFSFYWRWEDFLGPLLYLNKPKLFTVSLALRMFSDPMTSTDWGAIFAMGTLSLVPVLVIFVASQKYLDQGIATTGLKG